MPSNLGRRYRTLTRKRHDDPPPVRRPVASTIPAIPDPAAKFAAAKVAAAAKRPRKP